MRVLDVFENWAGKCVCVFEKTNCHFSGPIVTLVATDRPTHRQTGIMGYRKFHPLCSRICPYPFFEAHPRAPPPDPRLKPGPVFVASGGVKKNPDAHETHMILTIQVPVGGHSG